jgi:glycosyltransferase involved in cell wall biosynthesis
VHQRRILLLITDLEVGGTPTVVRELAVRLRRDVPGALIEVACLSKWGPVATQLQEAGVTVTALAARGSGDVAIVPRLIRLLSEKKFDTVFSFLVHANTVAALAAVWMRDVRWIQAIQTTQPWPRWHWLAQGVAQFAAEAVVVPSASVAACARDWSHIPTEKIVVIPNAIDFSDYMPARSTRCEERRQPFAITFIGRLDPVKNIPTLVEAIARLGAQRDGVHLHIYGDGSDHGRIERAIAKETLQQQVTLHGAIDRPQTALATSDLLVLPSLAEGFGLVLIEAMAAGAPVIATNVGGIRDVVQANETGLLVPPGNAAMLANAIKRMIQDPQLRQRLAANAARDVRERFTWERVLPQYRQLLRL